MKPQHIPAGVFKAKCLKIMDDVQRSHRHVIVTKHKQPLVEIKPIEEQPLFGKLRDTGCYVGDIISPIEADWDVLR